jgi:hypothetical protein
MLDGVIQATVESVGNSHWLRYCPLCGCMHQIVGVDESKPYTPLYQTLPTVYTAQPPAGKKLYSDIFKHTKVKLKLART